jgi:alpha-mannosidase
LDEGRQSRASDWVDVPITTRLSLIAGVPRLEIETTIDNKARDHRLRAHFPVPVSVDQFSTEGHFDVIARDIDLPQDTADWVEQPAPTRPQRRWIDVGDGELGLVVANRGLPEVEVMRTATGAEIALTCLRCVGWLSRGDLAVRRGHAGPGLPTPEAQCIGEYRFHYALIPHNGDRQAAIEQAHAFAAPLRAMPTDVHTGPLDSVASLIQVEPEQIAVSAVKEPENAQGLIVRFWNAGADACTARVQFWQRPCDVVRCTLGERDLEAIPIAPDGSVSIETGAKEIVTVRVVFESD